MDLAKQWISNICLGNGLSGITNLFFFYRSIAYINDK